MHYFLKFVSINQSYKLCTKSARIQCLDGSSWLTVSNQIVKSLSLSYKKFYFFNMVQPIDLIYSRLVEIIEQNIFNRADVLFRS